MLDDADFERLEKLIELTIDRCFTTLEHRLHTDCEAFIQAIRAIGMIATSNDDDSA